MDQPFQLYSRYLARLLTNLPDKVLSIAQEVWGHRFSIRFETAIVQTDIVLASIQQERAQWGSQDVYPRLRGLLTEFAEQMPNDRTHPVVELTDMHLSELLDNIGDMAYYSAAAHYFVNVPHPVRDFEQAILDADDLFEVLENVNESLRADAAWHVGDSIPKQPIIVVMQQDPLVSPDNYYASTRNELLEDNFRKALPNEDQEWLTAIMVPFCIGKMEVKNKVQELENKRDQLQKQIEETKQTMKQMDTANQALHFYRRVVAGVEGYRKP